MMVNMRNRKCLGARETAHSLRACTALEEDQSSNSQSNCKNSECIVVLPGRKHIENECSDSKAVMKWTGKTVLESGGDTGLRDRKLAGTNKSQKKQITSIRQIINSYFFKHLFLCLRVFRLHACLCSRCM